MGTLQALEFNGEANLAQHQASPPARRQPNTSQSQSQPSPAHAPQGPAIAWILSLLASMRAGWGLEWFVLSYAASAAWKGTRAILAGDVPVGALAFLATAAYAYHQRLLTKLAMCIFVGRIFATAVPRS